MDEGGGDGAAVEVVQQVLTDPPALDDESMLSTLNPVVAQQAQRYHAAAAAAHAALQKQHELLHRMQQISKLLADDLGQQGADGAWDMDSGGLPAAMLPPTKSDGKLGAAPYRHGDIEYRVRRMVRMHAGEHVPSQPVSQ